MCGLCVATKNVMGEIQTISDTHLARRIHTKRTHKTTTPTRPQRNPPFQPRIPSEIQFTLSLANQQHGRRDRSERTSCRVLLCINTGSSGELSSLASKCSRPIWVSSLSRWSQPSNFQCCLQLSISRALFLCILATLQGDDGDCHGYVMGTRCNLLWK